MYVVVFRDVLCCGFMVSLVVWCGALCCCGGVLSLGLLCFLCVWYCVSFGSVPFCCVLFSFCLM